MCEVLGSIVYSRNGVQTWFFGVLDTAMKAENCQTSSWCNGKAQPPLSRAGYAQVHACAFPIGGPLARQLGRHNDKRSTREAKKLK